MPITAARGDTYLGEDDLRAHLASLLRLENIGVLLGAGASVNAGGKVVTAVWTDFLHQYPASASRLVDGDFIDQDDANIQSFMEDPRRQAPNVELLLDKLEIAKTDWERRKPTSRNLRRLKEDIANLLRCVVSAAVLDRSGWEGESINPRGLESHRTLLQRLIGARQPGQPSPWVFTTNYDLAVEWAAESIGVHVHTGFVGIHNRTFSPQSFDLGLRNTQAKGEARFGTMDIYLAKLHGSLNWRCNDNSEYRELAATEMWPQLRDFIDDASGLDDSLMVYPRAAKYIQTVGYLSGELFRRFSDFLARPQSCLIISGFSFSDDHVNRLLKSALLNPTLQLVVFLPDFQGLGEEEVARLNGSIGRLVNLRSPRITIVGGGDSAYFDQAVSLLPDPVLYDLSEREMRERLRGDAVQQREGGNIG